MAGRRSRQDAAPLRVVADKRLFLDDRLIRLGLDELPDAALLIFDTDLRFVMARGAAVQHGGKRPDEMEGRLAAEALEPKRWAFYRPRYEAALRGEVTIDEVTSPDGRRAYAVRYGPIRESDGTIVGGSVMATEVTQLRQSQRAQYEADRRFRLAWTSAPIGMALVSLDRHLLEVNLAFAQMLGEDPDALVGRSLTDIIHPSDQQTDLELRSRVLAGDDEWVVTEKRLTTPNGATLWVQHSLGLMRTEDGEPAYFVSQFVDISEARVARESLRQMATTDSLTGLPNRMDLIERAGEWLTAGEPVAVLFCDLDGFKQVNDLNGHVVGDEVLTAVARRLVAKVRATDLIARFGGDEFVVVVRGNDCAARADRVAGHLISALENPVLVGGRELNVGLSVGIAVGHPTEDLDRLLARADAALYQAKSAGGNASYSAS